MNTKKEATQEAKKLLRKMKSKGWKIHVWENQGWYYNLIHNVLSLNVSLASGLSDIKYFCMLDPSYTFWTDHKIFSDPNEAVDHAIKIGRKVLNELTSVIVTAESI